MINEKKRKLKQPINRKIKETDLFPGKSKLSINQKMVAID